MRWVGTLADTATKTNMRAAAARFRHSGRACHRAAGPL